MGGIGLEKRERLWFDVCAKGASYREVSLPMPLIAGAWPNHSEMPVESCSLYAPSAGLSSILDAPIRSLAAEQEFGLSLRFTFRQALKGLDAGKGTRIRGLGFP